MKHFIKQTGEQKYFDGWIHKRFTAIKQGVLKDNRDAVFLIVGHEGEGKSTFCAQLCSFMSEDFSLDNVFWDANKLIEAVNREDTPAGTVFMLDEADLVMSNQTLHREVQKKLVLLLKTCRSKNLILFFVCPSWFDMNRYIAKHRPNYLFMVDSKQGERGYWYAWPRKLLPVFWKKAYAYQDMRALKPVRYGRFTHWWPFSLAEYERRKRRELSILFGGDSEKDWKSVIKNSITWYDNNGLLARGAKQKVAKLLGVTSRTITNWVTNI